MMMNKLKSLEIESEGVMPTKTELFEELKRLSLQIEHFESQRRNTFSIAEREEADKTLKYIWEKVDMLLDQYLYNKKFGHGVAND